VTFREGNEIEVTESGLTAYKVVHVTYNENDELFRLGSPQQQSIWPFRNQIEAACGETPMTEGFYNETADGPPPHQGHMCGIHAEKEANECLSYVQYDAVNLGGGNYQLGSVLVKLSLWGRVLEGTTGYRAQYAYPVEVYLPDKLADTVGVGLSNNYGCKIMTEKTNETAANYIKIFTDKCEESSVAKVINNLETTMPGFVKQLMSTEIVQTAEHRASIDRLLKLVGLAERDDEVDEPEPEATSV
jgi:hypothetical protein